MKATELYTKLDNDFSIKSLKDDWSFMKLNEYIAPGFKKCYMGVLLDNTSEVKKVYTATFPDLDILDKLIYSDQKDVLLFSHHAMGYDPRINGFPFYDIPEEYLLKLRQQRISLYVLHAPLDKNGEYSTSVNLVRNLEFEMIGEFCKYENIKVGILCNTKFKTTTDLAKHVKYIVGHDVNVMINGDQTIHDGRVAVAAGGGSVGFVAKELADLGINMYITGCTRLVPTFEPIVEFHKIITEKKINCIGATHYSTEKFACMAMVLYFKKLGFEADFLEGKYYLEDLY